MSCANQVSGKRLAVVAAAPSVRGLAVACVLMALAPACGGDSKGAADGEVDVMIDGSEVLEADGEEASDEIAEPNPEVSDGDATETDGVPEVQTDTGETDSGPTSSGYPAHGLVVRILTPGSMGTAEQLGNMVLVSGALFGDAKSMSWQAGTQSGSIMPGAFWQSGTLTLQPGDNRITVTASDATQSVTDTIVVTYNPSFRFDGGLVVRPQMLWRGSESEVVFTMKASRSASAERESMRLLRVDAQGELISDEGQMRDDGRVSTSGDEIEQDGLFTFNGRYTCLSAEPMFFRVSVKVGTTPSYTAVSSTVRVECLERVTAASCIAHKTLVEAAGEALAGGATLAAVQSQLEAEAEVASAGFAEDGGQALWVLFADGLLGAVSVPEPGVRGSAIGAARTMVTATTVGAPTVLLASKRALVLSPQATAFAEDDDGEGVAAALSSLDCPRYEVAEGHALADSEASIDRFRSASSFGIISIATEGEVLFGGLTPAEAKKRWAHIGPQEVLWTGSPVSCDGLLQTDIECQVTSANPGGGCPIGSRCVVTKGLASDSVTTGQGVCLDETQVDLRLGNALITNRGYAVTPSFFETWRGGGFPSSLVNLGGCRTMWNGSLAASLYAAGARAVTGFSGVVDSGWAKEKVLEMFEALGRAGSDGTVGSLFVSGEDPAHAGTFWRLYGASNLDLMAAGLINGDFETGSLVGWGGSGDGRAVAQIGDVQPASGKGMGLVSSGLGFSVETGTLEQTFCIPADKNELALSWKFMSEEFKEWCGNAKFQDRFKAELIDSGGAILKIVEVTVDDLCAYTDGVCAACTAPKACDAQCFAQDGCYFSEDAQICEGQFNCQCGRDFVGLTASSLGFDQGGVYEVMWRQSKIDVTELAGRGPVTLRLSVEDSGDSLFDTAVLVDAIEVR